MNTRFNYEPVEKRDSSKDDEFTRYRFEKRMKVISTNKDGSVDKYTEEQYFAEEKGSWSKFMKSYDIGSPSKQVRDHLTKGTPLVTAHTLPYADYTQLEKGAQIKKEMLDKGITLDMVVDAVKEALKSNVEQKKEEGEQNA